MTPVLSRPITVIVATSLFLDIEILFPAYERWVRKQWGKGIRQVQSAESASRCKSLSDAVQDIASSSAGWKSAIQQVGNLRYVGRALKILGKNGCGQDDGLCN